MSRRLQQLSLCSIQYIWLHTSRCLDTKCTTIQTCYGFENTNGHSKDNTNNFTGVSTTCIFTLHYTLLHFSCPIYNFQKFNRLQIKKVYFTSNLQILWMEIRIFMAWIFIYRNFIITHYCSWGVDGKSFSACEISKGLMVLNIFLLLYI